MKIKVTRPFFLAGESLGLDAETEVDDRFGRELIHNGKAVELKPEVDPELKPAKSSSRSKSA